MNRTLGLVSAVALIVASGTALAHHSGAMFDHTRVVVIKGTIKSFLYQSPHAWISIVGAREGEQGAEQWDLEGVAPGLLAMQGITRDALKPGDKVTARLYPLRDGRRAGSLINITMESGKTLGAKLDAGKTTTAVPNPPNSDRPAQ